MELVSHLENRAATDITTTCIPAIQGRPIEVAVPVEGEACVRLSPNPIGFGEAVRHSHGLRKSNSRRAAVGSPAPTRRPIEVFLPVKDEASKAYLRLCPR